jgi:hypothetical protein
MFAGVIARVIKIGGGVHAAPGPYDRSLVAGGGECPVGLAGVNSFCAAEESSVGAEHVPQVRIHASHLGGESTLDVTTRSEICG